MNVDIWRLQVLAVTGSVLFALFLIRLVRHERLRVEYSMLWLGTALLFIGASLFRGGLEWIAAVIGVAYAPSALFLIWLVGLVLVSVQFSVDLSRQVDRNRAMAQEIGLLREQIERLQKRVEAGSTEDRASPESN